MVSKEKILLVYDNDTRKNEWINKLVYNVKYYDYQWTIYRVIILNKKLQTTILAVLYV